MIRVIDYFLNELNMSHNDMTIKFKYRNNRYKIPMTHPLWWVITSLEVTLGIAGLWGFIISTLVIGSMLGLS